MSTVVEKLISFSQKGEGRDKFLKIFQYLGKLLKSLLENEYSIRFYYLSTAAKDSRKFFRLTKSLHEVSLIFKAFKEKNPDNTQRTLYILAKVALVFRWVFDNIVILSSCKLLKLDSKEYTRRATSAWLMSLVLNIANCTRELTKSYASEANIKERAHGKSAYWVVTTLDNLSSMRKSMYLEVLKLAGDMIIALNGAQVPFQVLGKQFSEKWVGIGGILSAGISCYQIWVE